MSFTTLDRIACALLVVLTIPGCVEGRKKQGGEVSATGSESLSPRPSTDTGIVEGTVSIEGDPAPVQPGLAARVTTECPDVSNMYGLLFREGSGRTVADVFVGVTGYNGVAADKTSPVKVTARGCTWDKRTYGLTAKQHIEVKSADALAYIPELFGAKKGASLVAVPNGNAIPVYSKGPGMYVLVDQMRNFIQATVLVVNFPTFDVTGLDGKFRIEGVPIGNAKLSAFLPTVNLNTDRPIVVKRNQTTHVDLKLRFDAAAFAASTPAPRGAAAQPPQSNAPADSGAPTKQP
ncbi:MAG TPA: hypothetical protein VKP30_08180 [Polyangiaceae bacterium]|nr:hypothetical protein [Polyangiaceae bacterium]